MDGEALGRKADWYHLYQGASDKKIHIKTRWYLPLPDSRETVLEMDSSIPQVPLCYLMKTPSMPHHVPFAQSLFHRETVALQLLWLKNYSSPGGALPLPCTFMYFYSSWSNISQLPPMGFWGSNSGQQALQQVLLLTEPSCCP